jgi:hypothetical protein
MFASNACHFVLFSLLSLSANAETVRGAQRELDPVEVLLGTAVDYRILAKAGISSDSSVITGDIGVSPIAATAMTGFGLELDSGGQFSTASPQITGRVYAASYGGPTATALTTAVSDMETAYTNIAGRAKGVGPRLNLGAGLLGGVFGGPDNALTSGVYTFDTSVTISGQIHFSGNADDIFIIQIAGDLLLVKDIEVTLATGVLARNIFWQVAGQADVKAGAKMKGILLVKTAVTFEANSSLNGRVLTQTRCNLKHEAEITA